MKKFITLNLNPGELIKQCQCGRYPRVIEPDWNYTDLWLQCDCGRRTINTGGFHYAREIPRNEAFKAAVALWESDDVYMENE